MQEKSAYGIDEPDLDKLCPFIGPPLMDSFQEFYKPAESAVYLGKVNSAELTKCEISLN